jgi:predicted dehydrogenase
VKQSTHILIFGRGAYVVGNTTTPPTILSAVLTSLRQLDVSNPRIVLLGKSPEASLQQKERVNALVNQFWGPNPISILYDACDEFRSHLSHGCHHINAAIVSLPDQLHFRYLCELATLAIPTICVKPVVTSLADYDLLLSTVLVHNAPIYIDFHKRLDPSFRYLKHFLAHDRPSYIESVDVFYSQPTSDLLVQASQSSSTNIFQYLGVHFIDIISWLFDSRLASIDFRIYPQMDSGLPPVAPRIDAYCLWTQPDLTQFFSTVSCRWSAFPSTPIRSEQYFRVKTNKHDISINLSDRGIHVLTNDSFSIPNPYFSSSVQSSHNPLISESIGYGHSIYYHFLAGALASDPLIRTQHYSLLPTLQSVRESVQACDVYNKSHSATIDSSHV